VPRPAGQWSYRRTEDRETPASTWANNQNAVACTSPFGDKCGAAARGRFVKYLPPFEVLKSYVTISTVNGELMVSCSYENLVQLIRRLIEGVEVDEAWYLERYQDIAQAITEGIVSSARSHFVHDGYFEGRAPFGIKVDEQYYLKHNSGVADYVRRGMLGSGQQHFDENGYKEGRLPFGF
jgi:hypothetical protein